MPCGSIATGIFLYDGDRLVAEYDAAGALLWRYAHGMGTDDPLVAWAGSSMALSAKRYLYSDYQGSVTRITDASGATTALNSYDEYGIPASTNVGRFQYTGQAWLGELGMYYYKARMYSPKFGRFMQTDPIGYDDQLNLYAYVGNDPVNGSDPSGMTRNVVATNCGSSDGTCSDDAPPPDETVVVAGIPKLKPDPPAPRRDFGPSQPYVAAGTGDGMPQNKQCAAPSGVAYYAGLVADYSDTGALISGGLAIATSETGAGLLGFGGVALLLKGVSLTANGVKIIAQARSGDIRGAGSTAAGALASTATGGALGAASKFSRTTGTLSKVSGLNKAVTYAGSETTSALSGKAGSTIVCPGS